MSLRHVAMIYEATLPYDLKVIEGVAAYVQKFANWNIYIEERSLRDQQLPDLKTWHGDGIIADLDNTKIAQSVRGLEIPVVGFGGGYGGYDPADGIPFFATDNEGIAHMAAQHLLDRGFQNFAFCGHPRTAINGWAIERAEAFQEYIEQAGFPCAQYTGRHKTPKSWAPMLKSICRWLEALEKPLGLMAASDKRARHVLEACRILGLRVPEEVAVIGVDNDEMLCKLSTPPLSSVNQGTKQIGYNAAALLDEMMAGKKVKIKKYITPPAGIVCRQSTDVLAINDQEMAEVVHFIREHATDGIKSQDVVRAMGVCRSTLDARFQALFGRTVHAEIRRVQLQRAQELIQSSDLPLKQVAQVTGFNSIQYLTYLLRKTTGQTPAELRQASQ